MKIYLVFLIALFITFGDSSEIDLSGFHTCEAQLIDGSDDVLAIYAPRITDCNSVMNIIALKKFDYRDKNGIPYFNIIDTISVSLKKDEFITIARCQNVKEQHILIGTDYGKENFGEIRKSWTFNSNRSKLIESNPKILNCLNLDFIE